MKKLFILLIFTFSLGIVTHAQDDKDKTKPTSTIPQKVHNTVSKHKKHKSYKAKHKHDGKTTRHNVDMKKGEVKDKSK